jgi:hypothetical protein
MEPEEDFQVVHHYRTRDVASIEEEPQYIIREKIGASNAQWLERLSLTSGVRYVLLYLAHQSQDRLRLYVDCDGRVNLVSCSIDSLKEEILQMLKRRQSLLAASSEQQLVQLLVCAVGARVFGIPEPIRKPVKRPWIRNRLVWLPPIDDIKEVSLNPTRRDLAMRLKADEMLPILQELINKVFDRQLEIAKQAAWIPVVPEPREK